MRENQESRAEESRDQKSEDDLKVNNMSSEEDQSEMIKNIENRIEEVKKDDMVKI